MNYELNNQKIKPQKIEDFRHLPYQNLKIKNSLLKEIDIETKKLEKYFFAKLSEFPKIFEGKNYTKFHHALYYVKSISIPAKSLFFSLSSITLCLLKFAHISTAFVLL